jgi:hypothetical protein
LGQSPDGADIFLDFGTTKTESLRGKSMDGIRRGFKTGSGLDPYKSQFILRTTPLFGKPSVLLNKKLVAAYGYIKGRMCIYSNPKLQILMNGVVLRNTWNDANSDLWTIDLPCIDHDGSKGENSNPFHGKTIDVLNKHSDYGTCSMAGSNLISHQSNEFDTGVSSGDNGHSNLFNIGQPNIIKLRLKCEAGGTAAVAGIINQDCYSSAHNWIQVDVFHYSRVVTIYERFTKVLCKCGRPRDTTPISISYSGAESGTRTSEGAGWLQDTSNPLPQTGATKYENVGDYIKLDGSTDQEYNSFGTDPCVKIPNFPKCKATYGLGDTGCGHHTATQFLNAYNVDQSGIKPGTVSCVNGDLGTPYVETSQMVGSECVSWAEERSWTQVNDDCPEWSNEQVDDTLINIAGKKNVPIKKAGSKPLPFKDLNYKKYTHHNYESTMWNNGIYDEYEPKWTKFSNWNNGNKHDSRWSLRTGWTSWGPGAHYGWDISPHGRIDLDIVANKRNEDNWRGRKEKHLPRHSHGVGTIINGRQAGPGQRWGFWLDEYMDNCAWGWICPWKNRQGNYYVIQTWDYPHDVVNSVKPRCDRPGGASGKGSYLYVSGTQRVCKRWKPKHWKVTKTLPYRTEMKFKAAKNDLIKHVWRKTKEWKLVTVPGQKVILPISEVHMTLCMAQHKCSAGKWIKKDEGLNSCTQCVAGRYRREKDEEDITDDADSKPCLLCKKGTIEDSVKRITPCSKPCPAGKYCLAGAYKGSNNVKDCPPGYFCPKGSSSYKSKKCAAGHFCKSKSIDKYGRSKASDEPRQCKAGYFCPEGASTEKGAVEINGVAIASKSCAAGYYCPKGATTQSVCGTFAEDSGTTWTNYCPVRSAKPSRIPNGWVGTGWSESRKSYSGKKECAKGSYCHRDELSTGRNKIDGTKCAAGYTGWTRGNMYKECNSACPEGYFCDAGTKLQWPSPNSAITTKWASIQCGKVAGYTTEKNFRFTETYAASVYCPAGTAAILYAPSEKFYTVGPTDTSSSLIGGKGVWRVNHDGDRDRYLNMRTGLKACQSNYLCIWGVRAPELEFITRSSDSMASYDGADTCGGNDWKTTSAMTATPNDAIKSQPSLDYLTTYATTRNTVTITIDDKISVGVKSGNALFHKAVYTISDSLGGTSLFEGTGYAATNDANEGVIKLINGKGVAYDRRNNGHTTRTLLVTATRSLKANTATVIKTRKACTIIVTVRNSNDRPWLTKGQVRTIEEQSAVDTLVQTPVEAHDYDEGQSFVFELDTTDDADGNGITEDTKLPFSIGKCSGILKVKNDVLRYDDDALGQLVKSRKYTLAIKVTDQDSDYANFDKDACNAERHSIAADAPGIVKGIYCQKANEGTIEVEILNKNDAPYVSSTDQATNEGFVVDENANLGFSVGTIAVSDQDIDDVGKHSFKILQLDSHDGFTINPETGEIKVKRTLDFEDKKAYRIKVLATDTGGWRKRPLSVEIWIDITVQDSNDRPQIASTLDASVDENLLDEVVVAELPVLEKDVQTKWNTIEFKFTEGSSDDFQLVSTGSGAAQKWSLQTKREFNYEVEKVVRVKVYAHDNVESSRSEDMLIAVLVNDVNESPIVSNYIIHVDENLGKQKVCKNGDATKCVPSEVAATFDMVDTEQVHTYTLLDHTSIFSIDANTGEIKTIGGLDKETVAQYILNVKIEDDDKDAPLSDDFTVTVNVDDVDEAPYIDATFTCAAVSEDADINDEICTIAVIDDDTHPQFKLGTETTIISGNEDQLFSLALNGKLTVQKELKLDYEEKNEYELMIRTASCTSGESGSQVSCVCSTCSETSGYSMFNTDKKNNGIIDRC